MANTELIKALEIRTSLVFDYWLLFEILSHDAFFLSFSIIDSYFSISAVIRPIFSSTLELAIPIITLTNKAKSQIEVYPVIADIKISGCSM